MECIIEGCDRKQRSRGLCNRCYQSAFHLINSKKTTWEYLEENGLALPAAITGRPRFAPFAMALKKAKEQD